jgi:hypothetical protein
MKKVIVALLATMCMLGSALGCWEVVDNISIGFAPVDIGQKVSFTGTTPNGSTYTVNIPATMRFKSAPIEGEPVLQVKLYKYQPSNKTYSLVATVSNPPTIMAPIFGKNVIRDSHPTYVIREYSSNLIRETSITVVVSAIKPH